MDDKEKKKKFNIPAFHVHVYKVVSKIEYDVFNEDEKEALEGALHLAKEEENEAKIIKADCEYVAVSFPFPKNSNIL